MSLIFTGDIALPYEDCIIIVNLPKDLASKSWVVNLEGSLVHSSEHFINEKRVFNDFEAIKELCNTINVRIAALANNHLFDAGSLDNTKELLQRINIKPIGAGKDLSDASIPGVIEDDGVKYAILNFGWKQIGCKYVSKFSEGVNPHEKEHVLNTVKEVQTKYPQYNIICFFHWDYELEKYPMPHDRVLAHTLIDMGVVAVVGCHSHRVQPVEWYKECPIIYSLGNFLFKQKAYWGGQLSFKDYTLKEMAFEYSPDGNHKIHWFDYNRETSNVVYNGSELVKNMDSELNGMLDEDYKFTFKREKIQNSLIPIFYYDDSYFIHHLKYLWLALYGKIKKILFRYKGLYKVSKTLINKPEK